MQMRKFLTLRSEVTYLGHGSMIEKSLDFLEQTVSRNTDIKGCWWGLRRIKDNYREILNHLRESLNTMEKLSRNLDWEAMRNGWKSWGPPEGGLC